HEIAHQWFGDMATETKFAHLWLSEGFATYMTALYMKNKYGRDTFLVMLKKDRLRVTKFAKTYHQPVVDTSVTDYMKLLNANSYQKGGWVLHMLRTMMGDSSFYRSIRKYYATYSGKNAGTDDLRRIMEEVSGKKLQPFFQQWLYTPGNPELDVTWAYKESEKQVYVTVIQKQSPAFQFPLQILFKNAGVKDQIASVQVNKQQEVFKIRATKKPDELILDPETVLLFEGTVH
ncbi:MAG TPA: M1 family aminopeptidase, partial [Flavitalea sp.]|nr:M1 family aminopeptidase [Flavitalea sp.]